MANTVNKKQDNSKKFLIWFQKIKNEHHTKERTLFDYFILILIVVSALLIGLETYLNSLNINSYNHIFEKVDNVILLVFVFEVIIKIYAYSKLDKPQSKYDFKLYFNEKWNIFDFTIVFISVVFNLVHYFYISSESNNSSTLIVLFRTLRVYRLFSHSTHLETLIETIFNSLKSMFYVLFMLGVLFFVYSIVGVSLYGNLNKSKFGTLSNSVYNLTTILTGNLYIRDNLNDIQSSLCNDPININNKLHKLNGIQCTKVHFDNDFDKYFILTLPIYIISFFFFGSLFILNLVIGIVTTEFQVARLKSKVDDKTEILNHLSILDKHIEELTKLSINIKKIELNEKNKE
jgi:hypothetical protein